MSGKTNFIKKFLPYIIISLGVVYGVWPLDVIPDIPIVGWIDDIGVMGTTILIAIMMYIKKRK
jgi:uncharacterized membrane protein YkvA (DUF1232 family)